jgi:hypothetical protein
LRFGPLQVVEQAAAACDEHQQAAPSGVILPVRPEMLCQRVDPAGQDRNLHFRGASVFVSAPELLDQFCFSLFGNCHLLPQFLTSRRFMALLPKHNPPTVFRLGLSQSLYGIQYQLTKR